MSGVIERLAGGLVVSCQPVPGGPLDRPEVTAAFALAALDGGAHGLRIEGLANLRAVRRVTDAPVIGLVKADLDDSPVRITPLSDHVRGLVGEGADIVAFDATDRIRPEPVEALVALVHGLGAQAMADCAVLADGERAAALGCRILGSTLSGYTGGEVPDHPDLELVRALAGLGRFTLAEGRYHRPVDAAAAIRAGAGAVVVGSAITRPEHVTSWFARAIAGA
ncbi:MAG: putative N-acetylmannosamine-6-phosphate 2-epimerase [Geminicoccaceae bacterium]|nr:putative N-acetylmannosamine-6-phosphate 2-epimerase [Geminicoccaceae bacterium]